MSDLATMRTLDFADTKRKSTSARSYGVKIAPANGATFQAGGQLIFNFPTLANSFADMDTAYIKMKVKNTNGNAVQFDSGSAYSLFQNVSTVTAGQTLGEIKNYSALMSLMRDLNTSPQFSSVSHYLEGAKVDGDRARGASIAATTGEREVCLPLSLLGIVESQPRRLLPLSASAPISLRVDLNDAGNAFYVEAGTPALTNAQITIVDCELCIGSIVELDPIVAQMVDNACGGVYTIMTSDYVHSSSTVAAGVSAHTATLGMSRSSLDTIYITHRNSANINAANQVTQGNRSAMTLTQFQISIDGTLYPARPVKKSADGAEVMATLLCADHSLVFKEKQSNFTNAVVGTVGVAGTYNLANGTLATPGTFANDEVGSFLAAVDLDQQGTGGSDRIFAGVDTLSSTVQYLGQYTSVSAAATVDFWGRATVAYTLDKNAGNVWVASV